MKITIINKKPTNNPMISLKIQKSKMKMRKKMKWKEMKVKRGKGLLPKLGKPEG